MHDLARLHIDPHAGDIWNGQTLVSGERVTENAESEDSDDRNVRYKEDRFSLGNSVVQDRGDARRQFFKRLASGKTEKIRTFVPDLEFAWVLLGYLILGQPLPGTEDHFIEATLVSKWDFKSTRKDRSGLPGASDPACPDYPQPDTPKILGHPIGFPAADYGKRFRFPSSVPATDIGEGLSVSEQVDRRCGSAV